MSIYVVEKFTPAESTILRRYFTNLNLPVFALVNLPEVVKGALFARYSRSSKSLRRLFLDEFVGNLDLEGDITIDATVGLKRAEELYEKVFLEYGDDSVAQLGGVHLACEQSSNLLTKALEWSRLQSYLEQSTRYIPYDTRLSNGLYRYYRDKDILDSKYGAAYVGQMDTIFDNYSLALKNVISYLNANYDKPKGDSDFVWRQAIKAKALDVTRGMLPAGSLSNVGIYGSGQSFELLILKLRASLLPEANYYAKMITHELKKVIPSFLSRVDRKDRGVAWTDYFAQNSKNLEILLNETLADSNSKQGNDEFQGSDIRESSVELVKYDKDGQDRIVADILYSGSSLCLAELFNKVKQLSFEQKRQIFATYVGDRKNRRHKPGRAFEAAVYEFDIVSDYGAFRDLQRHRMLTVEWQSFTPKLGWSVPEFIEKSGQADLYQKTLTTSKRLYEKLVDKFPQQASYALCLGFNVRYRMTMNAREAMHLIELRTSPQGHSSYRYIAQQMYNLILNKAKHNLVANSMKYVDFSENDFERLDSLRQNEKKVAVTMKHNIANS
jgi:thymidylate synthase ThyX